MLKQIKLYQVFYLVGILGLLNTTTKVIFPDFYDGNGVLTYIFGLPFYMMGLMNYNTMWLATLPLFDGAPLWLAIGFFLSRRKSKEGTGPSKFFKIYSFILAFIGNIYTSIKFLYFKYQKQIHIVLVISLVVFVFYWYQIRPGQVKGHCEKHAIEMLGVQGEYWSNGHYSDPLLFDEVTKLNKNKQFHYESCMRQFGF